jgi:hypothetical protein
MNGQQQQNSPFNNNQSNSPFGQQNGVGTTAPQASPSPQ